MTDELERLAFAAKQLLDLYPRLRDALAKDQSGTDGRSTGSTVPSIPVNPDVLESIRNLSTAIPTIDAQLRTALTFDRATCAARRTVTECLEYADALWRRLHAHPELRDYATEYVTQVTNWLRTARLALGLSQHPKPINVACPFCDGDLYLTGDEGHLHDPDDVEAITWERGEIIYCHSCGHEWPSTVWDILGNMIDAETQRQAEAS